MTEAVLIVDDEEVLRDNIVRFLRRAGLAAEGAGSAEAASARLADHAFDVVVTDLRLPGQDGIGLLEQIVREHPETLVVVITAHASVETAVGALRLGAQDYLVKPLSLAALHQKIVRLLEHRALEERVRRLRLEVQRSYDVDGMVATAPAMKRVLRMIERVAKSRSTVLLVGESGTGKELAARALHEQSPWADKEFIAVNLAAQPADLVDSLLFGHDKGAFTGAQGKRDGVFRAARGGTVFLDEIGELPEAVQVKLLRVLENREVVPLGSDRPVSVDFRLVCATHRDLARMVEQGRFRQDLFYRLNVLNLPLPPLRERVEDIGPLAAHFLAAHARTVGRPAPRLTADALSRLRAAPWPGNIRELSNAIERAVLLTDGDWIDADDLLLDRPGGGSSATTDLREAVAAFERRHIQRVLARAEGDKNAAAELLGVHLATLYRHLERLGLQDAGRS